MKNLITSIACVMILLSFVLQFAENQLLYNRMMFVDREADLLKTSVKQKGYPGGKAIRESKERICGFLSCSEEEVNVTGAKEPVPKGEIISYSIKVPLGRLMAAPFLAGKGDPDKIREYEARRFVISEYEGDKT